MIIQFFKQRWKSQGDLPSPGFAGGYINSTRFGVDCCSVLPSSILRLHQGLLPFDPSGVSTSTYHTAALTALADKGTTMSSLPYCRAYSAQPQPRPRHQTQSLLPYYHTYGADRNLNLNLPYCRAYSAYRQGDHDVILTILPRLQRSTSTPTSDSILATILSHLRC